MSEETELAWSAGFLDGEGTYGMRRVKKPNGHIVPGMVFQAQQVHREPLDRLAAILGGSVTGPYGPYNNNRDQPIYSWNLRSYEQVKLALFKLWPYMGSVKREQALRSWADFLETRAQNAGY